MYKLICKYVTGDKCEDVEELDDVWIKRVKTVVKKRKSRKK